MSTPSGRSLLLAWGVGLGLCGAGALVTRAATAAAFVARTAPATDTASAAVDVDIAPPDARPATMPTMPTTPSAPRDVPASHEPPTLRVTSPAVATSDAPSLLPRAATDRATAAALLDTLRRVLDQAVADSAFPGAFAIVGNSRGVLAEYGAGRIDWAADAPRPDGHTIWDLASLTKVVGMTSAIARLVDRGALRLDDPVQRHLPEYAGAGKERVTIRHLLTHSSGMPSWRPLHKETADAAAARALVLATPLDTAPGVRYAYSDMGAIILGLVAERAGKAPLDVQLARDVYGPLAMPDTRYRPDRADLARIAPTEIDPWRQRHLRGEVHDENAFFLGGVSGHAGLFSTGHDLARFARMYLGGGTLDGRRVLSRRTVATFTRVQDSTLSRRALGWETPTGSNSSGRRMSAQAFGHTGFTGTSLWMDPRHDVFVILLSNRVNPTRENRKIGGVRVALADAVLQTVAAPKAPASSPTPSTRP